MISISNKIVTIFFSTVIVIAAGLYAYSQEIYLLIAPIFLLASLFLIQHPEYLFYLLMIAIPWSVEFNFTPSLGTDLPDEPLMLLASAAVLILLIYKRKTIARKKLHPLLLLLSFELIWIVITVMTSTNFILSLKYLLAKTWYLLAFIVLPAVLFENEKILKKSFLLLIASMFIVTVIALIRHGKWNLTFETVNEAVSPFFRNHVNYSSLLVFMLPVQIAFIQLTKKKVRRSLCIVLCISVVALYFSYSRGAWLAFVIGMIAYWLLKKRQLFIAFVAFILIVAATFFWVSKNDRYINFSNDYKTTIFHSDFREHLIATYKLKDLSNAERIYRWVAGVRMVNDSWKTGLGPSTFYSLYKAYTLPAFKTYVSNNPEHSTVHNYFLLMAIEQGIIGLLLFVALIAAVFWYAQKIYHRTSERFWKIVVAAATSVMVMECTINFLSDMIETDKAGSIFYLCIATIIVADYKTSDKSYLTSNIQRIS